MSALTIDTVIKNIITADQSLEDRVRGIAVLLHGSNSDDIPERTTVMAQDIVAKDPNVRQRAQLILNLQAAGVERKDGNKEDDALPCPTQASEQKTPFRLNRKPDIIIDSDDEEPPPSTSPLPLPRQQRKLTRTRSDPLTTLLSPPGRVEKLETRKSELKSVSIASFVRPKSAITPSTSTRIKPPLAELRGPRRNTCRTSGEERVNCLIGAWHNPLFHKSCALVSYAWIRPYDLGLMPFGYLTRENRPFAHSALAQDSCVFTFSATTGPVKLASRTWHLTHINNLFESWCSHDDCSERLPQIESNWAIAVGCGVVQTEEEWISLVTHDLTVSHLCHNSQCREPGHLVLETLSANISRNTCLLNGMCECGLEVPCKLEYSMDQDSRLVQHRKRMEDMQEKLRRCPHAGCEWVNPYDFSQTPDEQPKHAKRLAHQPKNRSNGRHNTLSLIRQIEWLMLHLEEFKDYHQDG